MDSHLVTRPQDGLKIATQPQAMQSSVAYSDVQLREPTIASTPKTICAPITKRELIPVKVPDPRSGEDYLSIDIDIFSYALSARSPRVPTEVAENIIDLVTDGSVMRCCALVCTAWLPRSRVNIWRTIGLVHLRQVYSLRAVLEKTPGSKRSRSRPQLWDLGDRSNEHSTGHHLAPRSTS